MPRPQNLHVGIIVPPRHAFASFGQRFGGHLACACICVCFLVLGFRSQDGMAAGYSCSQTAVTVPRCPARSALHSASRPPSKSSVLPFPAASPPRNVPPPLVTPLSLPHSLTLSSRNAMLESVNQGIFKIWDPPPLGGRGVGWVPWPPPPRESHFGGIYPRR